MQTRRARRIAATHAVVAMLALGCHDEPLASESLEPPIEVGSVCSTSAAHCIGDSRILRCEGRLWTEEHCGSVCALTHQVALGCYDRAHADECLCAAPDAGPFADAGNTGFCAAQRECAGPDSLAYCDRYGVRRRSCADVCAELLPARRSAGCRPRAALDTFDDCACTFEGMPCPNAPNAVCDGPSSLARCVGGSWAISDCAAECAPGQSASCSSFAADAGAGCRCGMPP